MVKYSLGNKRVGIMLFLSTVCISLNINLGNESYQKAMAYEAHEFVFISGLPNLRNMNQEQADSTCKLNFRELRELNIFNENVEKNTWHIWAHVKNGDCVINIRNWSGGVDNADWIPTNNADRKIPVRVPRFN
jgi:hypothetical protein